MPFYPSFRPEPAHFVDREEVDDRLVINASYPPKEAKNGAIMLVDGTTIPLDTNSNIINPDHLKINWPSIESSAEILAVQSEAARPAKSQLYARTYDFSNWFRQLAVLVYDRWKCLIIGKDGYNEDFCM